MVDVENYSEETIGEDGKRKLCCKIKEGHIKHV
jgi:hypothetical protein